jgi:23S rRNA-/tRNA-specific pseudouridylate synthase
VLARSQEVLSTLYAQFRAREVRKSYLALVRGAPGAAGARGSVKLPLARDHARRPMQQVCHVAGKEAESHFEVLQQRAASAEAAAAAAPDEHGGLVSLVQLTPMTGRTHQLRVHMATLSTPIVGDSLYGSRADRSQRLAVGICGPTVRLCLHAAWLELEHPVTKRRLQFESSPAEFLLPGESWRGPNHAMHAMRAPSRAKLDM